MLRKLYQYEISTLRMDSRICSSSLKYYLCDWQFCEWFRFWREFDLCYHCYFIYFWATSICKGPIVLIWLFLTCFFSLCKYLYFQLYLSFTDDRNFILKMWLLFWIPRSRFSSFFEMLWPRTRLCVHGARRQHHVTDFEHFYLRALHY